MDNDDVTLDWGANEDDEVLISAPRKDAATLSGAESLLALASGPNKKNAANNNPNEDGDDKDSDVVSLGGDDNDMDELQAYQTRTHLGGMPSSDAKPAHSAKQQLRQNASNEKASSNERPTSPPPSYSPSSGRAAGADSRYHGDSTSNIAINEHLVNGKKREESVTPSKLRSTSFSDPARPPSLTSNMPLPGTHGLPPKPVATAFNVVPYVRPSHPSITSASTMAPLREREREHRRHASPRRDNRHYSPDHDLPPLAPDWEVRVARDGSNDTYYFNSKTGQSTWDRNVAAGLVPPSPPYYPTGRRSPGHDIRRGRASRRESSAGRVASPNLSYNDRHYSPPRGGDYYPAPAPVSRFDRGDSQRHQRALSPEFSSSHSGLRGNDRDISGKNYVQRARPHDGRFINDEIPSTRRDSQKAIERARSPSRGRDRYERPDIRDSVRISPTETKPKEHRPYSTSGSYGDKDGNDRMGPSPHSRTVVLPVAAIQSLPSAAQFKRAKSPQRDDRYIVPSHETNRVRNISPQAFTHDRPPKRMRSSKSPARPQDHVSSSSYQPLPAEWAAAQYKENKARHYTGPPRDRPPYMPEPILIPSAKYLEREENQKRELEKGYDTKRQKTTNDPDSTSTRRVVPDELGYRDARENDYPPRRSQLQADGSRTAPIGPRRRDSLLQPRREMDSYRPGLTIETRPRHDVYPERPPKVLDRDREGGRLELPTRPRAMDVPTNEPDSDRRNSYYRRSSLGDPTKDSGSGPRESIQPTSADHRSRQGIRNRPDDNPRDSEEGRYPPPANKTRFDTTRPMPPGLSGPNTIPLKPRLGDTYRPDEQIRRDRSFSQDAQKIKDTIGELHRSSIVEEEETSAASHYPSSFFLSVADRVDTSSIHANAKEERQSRFKDIEAHPSSSVLHDQKQDPRTDGHPPVARQNDAIMVENIPRVDTAIPNANVVPAARHMEIEGSNVAFAPPPPTAGIRRRPIKKVLRSEQSFGDSSSRQIHNLPPKPNVRPSSLLDRLSNPGTANSRQSPTLRERVAQDASSSKLTAQPGGRPSLRDRLDSPDIIEHGVEDHQRQGGNGHHHWKNNRTRRGRGAQ